MLFGASERPLNLDLVGYGWLAKLLYKAMFVPKSSM